MESDSNKNRFITTQTPVLTTIHIVGSKQDSAANAEDTPSKMLPAIDLFRRLQANLEEEYISRANMESQLDKGKIVGRLPKHASNVDASSGTEIEYRTGL